MLLPVPRLEAHPKAFASLFNLVYIGFANNSARAEIVRCFAATMSSISSQLSPAEPAI
jgi:hypothetical protein